MDAPGGQVDCKMLSGSIQVTASDHDVSLIRSV